MEDIDKFALHLLKYFKLNEMKSPTISILDFGGGDGTLSKKLCEKAKARFPELTFHISVVDFNSDLEIDEPGLSMKSFTRLEEVTDQTFDVVMASAIVEHIPEAGNILDQLLSKVKPDGYFYARTPSSAPLKKLLGSFPLLYPMHVHDMGASFWNRVPARAKVDLEVICSQPSVVMTSFSKHFFRTLAAYVLKSVARLEKRLRNNPQDYWWNLVGGWEVFYRVK